MTVADNYVPVVVSGTATEISFSWQAYDESNLVLELEEIATGTRVTYSLGSDYTAVVNEGGGGIVTIITGSTASYQFILSVDVPLTQESTYSTSRGFQGEVVENSFDKLTSINQQQQDDLERSLRLPTGTTGVDTEIPTPDAGKALLWNSGGTAIINSTDDFNDIVDDATAQALAAAASAAAALVSENNAAADAVQTAADRVQTGLDATATASDRVQTGLDVTSAEAAANAVAYRWDFDTSTTMADPTTGLLRLNNATPSSVTSIAVSALSAITGNPDISDTVATWGDSTNVNKGVITIRKSGDATVFANYDITAAVTDNSTWLQLTVTYTDGNGTFSASDELYVSQTRSGDAGTGFNSGDITGQTEAVIASGDYIVWSDTDDSGNLKKDTVDGITDVTASTLAGKADTVITASDKITFYDATDSDLPKTDTVQGILDLAPSGGFSITPQTLQSSTTNMALSSTEFEYIEDGKILMAVGANPNTQWEFRILSVATDGTVTEGAVTTHTESGNFISGDANWKRNGGIVMLSSTEALFTFANTSNNQLRMLLLTLNTTTNTVTVSDSATIITDASTLFYNRGSSMIKIDGTTAAITYSAGGTSVLYGRIISTSASSLNLGSQTIIINDAAFNEQHMSALGYDSANSRIFGFGYNLDQADMVGFSFTFSGSAITAESYGAATQGITEEFKNIKLTHTGSGSYYFSGVYVDELLFAKQYINFNGASPWSNQLMPYYKHASTEDAGDSFVSYGDDDFYRPSGYVINNDGLFSVFRCGSNSRAARVLYEDTKGRADILYLPLTYTGTRELQIMNIAKVRDNQMLIITNESTNFYAYYQPFTYEV